MWGGGIYHGTNGKKGYRHTYLTHEIEVAQMYGDVVLEVEYTPRGIGVRDEQGVFDNYGFDPPPGMICWQFAVFQPIPLGDINLVETKEYTREVLWNIRRKKVY